MESTSCNESLATKKDAGLNKKCCRVHIHHKTQRLSDPDGRSIKACIDGLVVAGILPDDNAKIINQTSQSQEKSKQEETIIDIIWEDLK